MQIFCRRDQKEKLSEIKLPLKIEDCWYEFAIKKCPDELHTLVGDPEQMKFQWVLNLVFIGSHTYFFV